MIYFIVHSVCLDVQLITKQHVVAVTSLALPGFVSSLARVTTFKIQKGLKRAHVMMWRWISKVQFCVWCGELLCHITAVMMHFFESHTNWVAVLKALWCWGASIFCDYIEQCSIVTFLSGAYIYIFLHGFRMELKLSPGVFASGEFNLLWHFSCCRRLNYLACELAHLHIHPWRHSSKQRLIFNL